MASRRRIWLRRGMAFGVVTTIAVGLVVVVGAVDSGPPDPRQAKHSFSNIVLDGDGWPLLSGEISEDGVGGESWQVCRPRCGRAQRAQDAFFAPGPTAAGTRFRLSARAGDVVWEEFSPVWTGRVRNTRPPTLRGNPTLGTVVVPSGGVWTGGWQPGDRSDLGVRACRTRDAIDCVAMTQSVAHGSGGRSLRLSPALSGWYVGAIEVRDGYLSTDPAVGYAPIQDPESAPRAPAPGQVVAVGPLIGPVG